MSWLAMEFDKLVRAGMMVRDVKIRHPESVPVFEKFGFRPSCDDCSIEQVARKYGLDPLEVVAKLNQAIFQGRGSRD